MVLTRTAQRRAVQGQLLAAAEPHVIDQEHHPQTTELHPQLICRFLALGNGREVCGPGIVHLRLSHRSGSQRLNTQAICQRSPWESGCGRDCAVWLPRAEGSGAVVPSQAPA